MAGGSQISALHLALAAGGGVLLYAALQDMTPLEAFRELTSGKAPKAIESKKSSLSGSSGSGVRQSSYGGSGSGSALVAAAEKYLGVPYVYGGTTSRGLDCSGLVVLAFRDAYGVEPPRTTYGQEPWKQLRSVNFADLQAGDLVFWPGHVAIYVGDGRVIHAPRPGKSVEYADMDTAGPAMTRISSFGRYIGGEDEKPKSSGGRPDVVEV